MILICTKSTKRIIKGLRYEAVSINNARVDRIGSVSIKDIGSFSANNFTTIDGEPVPKITYNITTTPRIRVDVNDIKVGDKLVCLSDNYKSFDKNVRYEIETAIIEVGQWRSRVKIKFVGNKQKIYFSEYSFRKLTTAELREEKLCDFFEEEEDKPQPVDKNIILMDLLCRSIIDHNRHHLSIVEWGVKQLSKKRVNVEDYSELLQMKLEDIIALLES